MITYTVVKNDTLSGIAYKNQTTVAIIMADNSIIKDKNKIQAGWKLKIRTTVEYAKDQAKKAEEAKKTATTSKSVNADTSTHKKTGSTYSGLDVMSGQTGIIEVTSATNVLKDVPPKVGVVVKSVKKGTKFQVYGGTGSATSGVWYIGGGQYIKKSDSKYEALPSKYISSTTPGTSKDAVGTITQKEAAKTEAIKLGPNIGPFENPYYRRPVLTAEKSDGKKINMELRVLGVSNGYSNQLQQNKTNGGFFINVSGYNLPIMTINGVFLDSKTNKEFDDFLDQYLIYLQSYKSDDFYSFSLCRFYYKNREYKGLVAAFNYTDTQDTPLTKNFSLQFLILKEKRLVTSNELAKIPTVVDRDGMSEEAFLSDLGSMLTNPITGIYGTS